MSVTPVHKVRLVEQGPLDLWEKVVTMESQEKPEKMEKTYVALISSLSFITSPTLKLGEF